MFHTNYDSLVFNNGFHKHLISFSWMVKNHFSIKIHLIGENVPIILNAKTYKIGCIIRIHLMNSCV